MKYLSFAALLVVFGVVVGCSAEPRERAGRDTSELIRIGEGEEFCVTLFAGRHIVAGEVCSTTDNTIDTSEQCGVESHGVLQVSFATSGGWELVEAHLAAGDDLDDIQTNRAGSPQIGRFPYHSGDIAGATSHSFQVPLCELGLDASLESCDPVTAFVAAHAALRRDNGDGTYQTETGWGDGERFRERGSWAEYFTFTLECYPECVPGFDEAAFETLLDDLDGESDVVGLRVYHQGGTSGQPYFRGELDFDGDGTFDEVDLPTFCVDLDHTIASGRDYCARLYSSFDDDLPEDVNHPENLDLVTYIMNNYDIGDAASDGTFFTGGDFQRAYWSLIFGSLPSPGAYASGPSSDDRVSELLDAAWLYGEGYEPPCDGVVPVIIYPVGCGDDTSLVGQVLVAQMLVTELDSVCEVCEPPPGPADCETAFAYGDQCFLDIDEDGDGVGDFSRWGWRREIDGSYTADIFAGAGRCDVSTGTLVGSLDIGVNDDGTVSVSYFTIDGFWLDETHLYVGENLPTGPDGSATVAPGQYTEFHEDLDGAASDAFTLPGGIGDYLIAHAVVCGDFGE